MEKIQNKEIASMLKQLGKLLEVHGENEFKTKSYSLASFQISRLHKQLADMSEEEIHAIPRIGKTMTHKIMEILETGQLQKLNDMLEKTPEGILEIMQIKGLGGKKIGHIWRELQVESPGALLYACYENRLAKLKGFGSQTQENIIKAIEYYQANLGKYHYASLEGEAFALMQAFEKAFPDCHISFCGEFRRKEIIVPGIDILIGASQQNVKAGIEQEGLLTDINYPDEWQIVGKTQMQTPVTIHLSGDSNFAWRLFELSSSQQHIEKLGINPGDAQWPEVRSEEAIYEKVGVPYIIPEWREGTHEIEWAKAGRQHDLIRETQIRGIVHAHSHWSDGRNSLEEMAKACRDAGYEYLIITDHSQTAVYAGGLKEEDIIAQHREVDQLNESLKPFRIIKGIESDILSDGSLDYPEDVLKSFECIIASIHSGFRQDEATNTRRLIKAIENPHTRILGHMSGRLLLSRDAYPINQQKVIDACAANGVIIELNANPYRLDIDWHWIPYALEKDIPISINPDAHSKEGIGDVHYGVLAARKGGLTTGMTWNAKPLKEISEYLSI